MPEITDVDVDIRAAARRARSRPVTIRLGSGPRAPRVNTGPYAPYLRQLVDFCCDRYGCGHHIDGHGYGETCHVPGCECTGWRDHVGCGHRDEPAAAPGPQDLPDEWARALLAEADQIGSYGYSADDVLHGAIRSAYRVGYASALGHEITVDEGGDAVCIGDRPESAATTRSIQITPGPVRLHIDQPPRYIPVPVDRHGRPL